MPELHCKLLAVGMDKVLNGLDWGLAAVGGVLALVVVTRAIVDRRTLLDPALPPRPHRMPPEAILFPMLAYLVMLLVLHPFFRRQFGVPADAGENDTSMEATLAAVLTNNLAIALAMGATLFVGWRFVGTEQCRFIRGPRRWWPQLVDAVCGVLIAFALCHAALKVTTYAIEYFQPAFEPPDHDVINALRDSARPDWLPAVMWIGVVVVTPIAEECFFRGILQTALAGLLRRRGLAIAGVGVIFGLAHASQPQVVPALVIFGVILGILYERSGGLLGPIVAHALFNARTLLWESLKDTTGPV